MAQPSATDETKTGALGNGVAYRYWRFMVTDTHFNGTDGNGHKYFALSDFNVYKCTDVVLDTQLKSEYTSNIYIYKTNALVTEVGTAISAATAVYDDAAATAADCDNAIADLQPVKDKLAQAIEYYWCPVQLTTDATAPALYTIDAPGRSDANNSKAWQYNAQNNNITIVNKDTTNLYHLWYFVEGVGEHTVKIVPVMTPEYGLTATEFGEGADKVSAANGGIDWAFAYVNDNWNFKPYGKNTTYLSNIYGGTNALGFYGGADGGSYVSFSEVEVENYLYARLQKLIDICKEKYGDGEIPVVEKNIIGCYPPESAEDYNSVYSVVTGLAAGEVTEEHFGSLWDAYHALELNMPVEGAFYRIRSACTDDYCNDALVYVNNENEMQFAKNYDEMSSRVIWYFTPVEGGYNISSMHTCDYVPSQASYTVAKLSSIAKVYTVNVLDNTTGELKLISDMQMHAQASGSKIVGYNTNSANTASSWYIEKVADDEIGKINHTVTMSATFSSVMLGYNATVPAGVEAYNAEGVEDGYVSLVEVAREDGVIPANTPVILYRTDDTEEKIFTYTEDDATNIPDSTVLGGSLYTKYVECDGDKDYYKLMIKEGVAKMYWMYKEFNAEGVSQGYTNDGGHIKCSANKIYMALPSQQQPASYGMRFVGGEATGVEEKETENGKVETIYDLQGRKLTEITHPGFYMINGKKVYVK